MEKLHKLLKRQLLKNSISFEDLPINFQKFINDVNEAYFDFDEDRSLIERALDLSSQELLEKNTELRSIFESIPELLFRVDKEGKIFDSWPPGGKLIFNFVRVSPTWQSDMLFKPVAT